MLIFIKDKLFPAAINICYAPGSMEESFAVSSIKVSAKKP